jgi:hypothetical protein
MSESNRDCEHGRLARSCTECLLISEIKELEINASILKSVIDHKDLLITEMILSLKKANERLGEMSKLEAENAKLREGLVYYADTTNWITTEENKRKDCIELLCDREIMSINWSCGGKLARHILKEIESND